MKMIKTVYSPVNCLIFLGETVKAALSLWLVFLVPSSHILIPCYLLLQFFFAPVQGGKSDNICRKNALLVATLATAIAQIFFFLALLFLPAEKTALLFLIIGLFVQARWGNIPAIGRASLADSIHPPTFALPLSFSILAFPWLIILKTFPTDLKNLHFLIYESIQFRFLFSFFPFFISLASVITYFYIKNRFHENADILRANHPPDPKFTEIIQAKGLKRIKLHLKYELFFNCFELKKTKELIKAEKLFAWIGGLFYEYGFHSIFYHLDESGTFVKEGALGQSSLFVYYIAGTLFRPGILSSNSFGIILGIIISVVSVLLRYVLPLSPALWQGVAGFGSGLFLSCFYLYCLTGRKSQTRGKITGAADSMQLLGEGLAAFSFLFLVLVSSTAVSSILTDSKVISFLAFITALCCFIYSFKKEKFKTA